MTAPCQRPSVWVFSWDEKPTPHQANLILQWTAVTPWASRKVLRTPDSHLWKASERFRVTHMTNHVTKFFLSLPFTVHCFYLKISCFTPVLSIRIVLSCFICLFSIFRNSQLESDVCRETYFNWNMVNSTIRDLKKRWRWRKPKRRSKSDLAFFQSSSRLFHLAYFVKCGRTLLELNS